MKIVVDAFGGDNAPNEIIKGAAAAVKELGVGVILTGNSDIINKYFDDNNISREGIEIVHTDDVISMHDEPTSILKEHRNSSMAKAFDILCEGSADAFVSAGSTGAIVVGGTLLVKRIKGVKRPAIATVIPSPRGSYMLMDSGANSDCRPEMLCQFGVMSSVYMERVMGIQNPKVALLNIGTEDTKGDQLRLESFELLKNAPINFVGNVEAREVPNGVCDAVVADGFTGNVVLKLIEGTSKTLFKMIKEVLYKGVLNKLAALVLKKDLYSLKEMMNSSNVGGAILLGVRKPVIKAHGNSDAKAIKNAIKQAVMFASKDVISAISDGLSQTDGDK